MSDISLAFDTSTPIGSVALARGADILGSRFLLRQFEHAAGLIPAVDELLRSADLVPRDLSRLVVGEGPGSFTGVRVAAATAKGLAATLDLPVWAFSSLLAAAMSHGIAIPAEAQEILLGGQVLSPGASTSPEGAATSPESSHEGLKPVVVVFDARANRVYSAAYDLEGETAAERMRPFATTIGELLANPALAPGSLFCGDGALRHRETILGEGFTVVDPPMGIPTAEGLLRVFSRRPAVSPVTELKEWQPTYLRGTGARPLPVR